MKVLVTGGSGFVGGNLAKLLVSKGHSVTALVRRTSNRKALEPLGVQFAIGDLNTGEGLEQAVAGMDAVIHVAGVVKALTHDEYLRGNAEGTRLLCAAMAKQPSSPRMVYCSSLAAAGPATPEQPRTEDQEPGPISIYGRSKLGGELAVRKFADRVPSVIVRPPFVYGPGDTVNLPSLLTMGKLGVYVKPGFRPKYYSFIHVDDLSEALLAAALSGKTLSTQDPAQGVYFVADPKVYSWEEFCGLLSSAMGKTRPKVISVPDLFRTVVGIGAELGGRLVGTMPIMNRDKAHEMGFEAWTCSPQRAREELQFTPKFAPLEAGLADTVAWYRQEGMI